MPFVWLGPNAIESDEGFRVELISATQLRYVEDGHEWRVSSEFLTDDAVPLAVYRSTIALLDSNPNAELGIAQDHIIENIRRAFRSRGVEIEVL